jgi:hypothetical protein
MVSNSLIVNIGGVILAYGPSLDPATLPGYPSMDEKDRKMLADGIKGGGWLLYAYEEWTAYNGSTEGLKALPNEDLMDLESMLCKTGTKLEGIDEVRIPQKTAKIGAALGFHQDHISSLMSALTAIEAMSK